MMSKVYEFQGKNVEQALQNASDALNLPVNQIQHEVVAYGSSGIFGLVGVKKAKIKVFATSLEKRRGEAGPGDTETADGTDADETKEATIRDQERSPVEAGLAESGRKALKRIVDSITSGAQVSVDQKKDKLNFSISGGESGVLIGKRGQTLEAIQYLLEKMINKKSTHRVRVLVDVAGYLQKRKNNLRQMASRMADKAKRTKKPVTIGQMNAHDRRIVHIHLKDEEGVRTQSVGEGYYRKLMIFPKKQAGAKPKKGL
jgi:spoIIIJ-associated protein